MARIASRPLAIAVSLVLLLSLAPLRVRAGKAPDQKLQIDPKNLVWPLPPDKPRVKWLEMWSNNFEIEPKKKRGFLDRVAGVADPNRVEVFRKPSGIAIDSKGRIYVAALDASRVYVLDKEHKKVIRIEGDRGFQLRSPVGLLVDSKDNLYVADSQLHMVLKFDPRQQLISTFGAEAGMKTPAYMALDEGRKRLYVVDTRQHQILVYDPETLKLIKKFGSPGEKNDQFEYPVGIAVNPKDGSFAVTDTGTCAVKIYSPEFKFIRKFGKQGTSPGNFVRPKGVAYDSEGHIWVVDAAFNNFQIFNDKGQLLLFVGSPGYDPGQFQLPNGIFIDKNNRVYISDQLNSRIQVFQFLGGAD